MGLPTLGPDSETQKLTERIKAPNGVPTSEWYFIIELAVQNYNLSAGLAAPEKATLRALDVDNRVSDLTWSLLFDFGTGREKFYQALAARGVVPLGQGLTTQQMLAIDIVSNPNVTGTWNTKLKKAGVTPTQWTLWMANENFANQFRTLIGKRINQALPVVDGVLASKAIAGELDAIKYFDKRTGRDPDKREEMSSRQVVSIVLDALTKHLSKDPDKLRAIAAEIEVRMKLDG